MFLETLTPCKFPLSLASASSQTPLPLLLLPLQGDPTPACNPLTASWYLYKAKENYSEQLTGNIPCLSWACPSTDWIFVFRDFSVWRPPFWSREPDVANKSHGWSWCSSDEAPFPYNHNLAKFHLTSTFPLPLWNFGIIYPLLTSRALTQFLSLYLNIFSSVVTWWLLIFTQLHMWAQTVPIPCIRTRKLLLFCDTPLACVLCLPNVILKGRTFLIQLHTNK